MKEERLKEISAFATHRLVTGDILAAYTLELAVELRDAERERDQANALLSAAHAFHDLAVKERDAERVKNTALRLELESATRNISRLLAAVEKWEALAGAAITSRQEAALSRGAGGED